MRWWIVFVTIAVAVSAVKAQDYYDGDDHWDLALDEADTVNDDTKNEELLGEDVSYEDKNYDTNLSDVPASLNEDNKELNTNDNQNNEEEGPTFEEAEAALGGGTNLKENVPIEDIPVEDEHIHQLVQVAEENRINSDKSKSNEEGGPTFEEAEAALGVENDPIEDLRAEDGHVDQLVQEKINRIEDDMDEMNSVSAEDFYDYQVEDNRSDKEKLPSENSLASHNGESLEMKDHNGVDPVNSFDMDINYPEFGGDLDSIAIRKEKSPDIHQIIADANKLLNEENDIFEEDIVGQSQDDPIEINDENLNNEDKKDDDSDKNKDNNDANESPQEITNKKDEINTLIETEDQGNLNQEPLGELDENSEEDTAVEDLEQQNDDDLRNENKDQGNLNQELLGELDENSEEDTAVEDLQQQNDDDLKDENSQDLPDDTADTNSAESVKYENDMINPEEVEEAVNDESPGKDFDYTGEKFDEDTISEDEVQEEDTVDKVYKDLNADLEKLFATWDKLTSDDSGDKVEKEGQASMENPKEDATPSKGEPEEHDTLNEDDLERENTVLKDREALDKYIDKYGADDSLEDDSESNEYYYDENIFAADTKVALNDEREVPKKDVIETKMESTETNPDETEKETVPSTSTVKTIDVTDLTPEQYNDLMNQFQIVHASELDTEAEDFGKYIAAVHMTLTAEEPIEITSPNFPNTYPTNNVLDWILEGDGSGVELNITDLAVRGVQGDFLLVKPGPPNYHNSEEVPEPEPLLPSPTATITVNLAGVTVFDFTSIKSDFQRIIADMATIYINANGIDAGLNSTSEVTQITSVSSCKANWPNFENCVAVSFGVPLVYEDDEEIGSRLNETDLEDMWKTSVNRDPFAARFRALGISEFDVPNDRRIMLVWVVLAVGILISAAMVAFTLWRYSCFEDYTRMKSFSDTDSMADQKRGLDLYPTPHQDLPPLYAEQDYKWADSNYEDTTTVDLGGFANRSFARDELVDIYSDEDVAVKRDRFTTDV